MAIVYKIASDTEEMNQIFRLNYETFVDEIPQHRANEEGLLIDRYHEENVYLIAKKGPVVAAMLAVRSERPFSMDAKVADFERYLPEPEGRLCEIRLLAVARPYRRTKVLFGLLQFLERYHERCGYGMAVISATTRELGLYRHLGFVPFAPLVGPPEAAYQPMYLTPERYRRSEAYRGLCRRPLFTAGPVNVSPTVRAAFGEAPVPHRSGEYRRLLDRVVRRLLALTSARRAAILLGSGTLANEAVAAQLSRVRRPGLIAVNGEFGRRLTEQADRWGLAYRSVESLPGRPLDYARIEELAAAGEAAWLWAVHGETSTGVLNDAVELKRIAREQGLHLALDCVSSLGAVPVDLTGVTFATGVSGKSLGAYAGLSFVFYDRLLAERGELPAYLDLAGYEAADGIPFSHSSNLTAALDAALEAYEDGGHRVFAGIRRRYDRVGPALERLGFSLLADAAGAAPYIVTVTPPYGGSSREWGDAMKDQGLQLQYESGYLLAANRMQIALVGHRIDRDLDRLLAVLEAYIVQGMMAANGRKGRENDNSREPKRRGRGLYPYAQAGK